MDYVVSLDEFQGPLDLLLSLIKEDNIDITEISILKITEQYLNYINKYKEMNLNLASEYLVMAAELIEMKSKILLPRKTIEQEEEIIEDRETLISRLKEYEAYKNITGEFKSLEEIRKEYFTKNPSYGISDLIVKPNLDDNITIDDLTNAFTLYLERKEKDKPLKTKVTTKEYSILKRSNEIREVLKAKNHVSFDDLFEFYNRGYVVVTFLSILIMAKNNEIKINQDDNFSNIYIDGVNV